MTRRLHNWTYRDVITFLREKGFHYSGPIKGSHEAWVKVGKTADLNRTVEVNFTHGSYPVKTLKTMIYQSGTDQDEWIKWAQGKR